MQGVLTIRCFTTLCKDTHESFHSKMCDLMFAGSINLNRSSRCEMWYSSQHRSEWRQPRHCGYSTAEMPPLLPLPINYRPFSPSRIDYLTVTAWLQTTLMTGHCLAADHDDDRSLLGCRPRWWPVTAWLQTTSMTGHCTAADYVGDRSLLGCIPRRWPVTA